MEQNKPKRKVLGSEALGELLGRMKDGTFKDIINDWKWIAAYTRRYRAAVIIYTLLGILSASFALVSAVASKYTIDIITGHDRARLWFVIAVMIASSVVSVALKSTVSRISAKVSIKVNNDIQAELFDKVIRADWNTLNGYPGGDLLNRLNSDAYTVAGNAISWLPDLIIASYTFIITLLSIMYYDAVMALLALSSAPFLIFSARRLIGRMRSFGQKVRELNSGMMAFETETFNNLDSIKSFGITDKQSERLRQMQGEYKKVSLDYNLFSIKTEAVLSLIGSAVQMAAFCYCLYLLWNGKILYGTMTLFLSQGAKLSSAFNSLVKTVPVFLNASVSATRIRELMAMPPEECGAGEDTLNAARGLTVRLEDVSFAYKAGETVLDKVNFTAAPGEIVAVIGPSGGGKTTLCQLIPRFYDVTEGAVLIDGHDVRKITQHSLRQNIGIVQQEVFLFADSVLENIRYGRPDATDEEVVWAARQPEIHEDILAMPNGYETYVGERGVMLSGGQKQRISIARVFLKNPPIVILDEATSALDSVTEAKIQASFDRLCEGRTSIIIAHRLSTIRNADRIAVIDREEIIEQGSHPSLMAQNGEYAALVRAQEQIAFSKNHAMDM